LPEQKTILWRICMLICLVIGVTACNLNDARPISRLETTQQLVVAWVDRGNLIVWTQGDDVPRRIAVGGVIRPFVSPDGQRIAFTRGPAGRTETLWVVDVAGNAEMMLIGEGTPRGFASGQSQVGNVGWFDETTLYANTLSGAGLNARVNDNLYRINVRTREVSLILPNGEGGRFVISPDGTKIATASAGTYGRQDARISVVDPLAFDDPTSLLFYIGVATGAELPFRPRLHWTPDSQSVLVAIPDSDLIYSETEETVPPTRLWQLPVDNPSDRNLLGSVQGSFFGLPTWSDSAEQMVYLRRTPDSNAFTLVVADANGDNPTDYLTGDAGTIDLPIWLPDSHRFLYSVETPGRLFIGERGQEPVQLSQEVTFSPQFISDDLYLFVTSKAVSADGFQLRYARLDQQSVEIADVGQSIPLYDAVMLTIETQNY